MPKVKIKRKGTPLDMTAMCDVAFLLLTFFILTSQFKAEEAVIVDTPSSSKESQITVPDRGVATIAIGNDNKVFFGFKNADVMKNVLAEVGSNYNIEFTTEEAHQFSLLANFGVPVGELKTFLKLPVEKRKNFEQKGIPCDSVDNQLAHWIRATNYHYNAWLGEQNMIKDEKKKYAFRIAVKGDKEAKYESTKKVITTLQLQHLTNINFITNLEGGEEKASVE